MPEKGEPSVCGGKYPRHPAHPSGACQPEPGGRPDDKGPGDREKVLGFSLPCACSRLGVLTLPVLGLRLFQGAPAQRCPTGAPCDRKPGQAVGRDAESASLQTGLWPLAPQERLTLSATLGLLESLPPLEVATIPARSSLEETSLGELLPGSILSDSLKTKIFKRLDGLWCVRGWGAEANMCTLGTEKLDCC